MINTQIPLQATPLYSEHVKLKARMVPFAGWSMPVQYEGILVEYEQTRRAAAVFDTSHMGEFIIEGKARESGLDRIVTQRIADMPLKTCRYGMMLDNQAGIMDDLIVYRIATDKWMIVVNAADIEKKAEYFERNLSPQFRFKDASHETGKLDVQGPLSREVLADLVPAIQKLDYFTFDEFDLLGYKVMISRTGYTGELGYEIYFPWDKLNILWQELLKNKEIKPAGLGARDVLRLEMGYSLYGQDLDLTISPLEAGLHPFLDFEKDFIGKEALLQQKQSGVKRKMIFFSSDSRQSPRHHFKIFSDDKKIGVVTSGTFSPSLKKGIGMGLVERTLELKEKKLYVGEEKNRIMVYLTQRPFYKNGSLRN